MRPGPGPDWAPLSMRMWVAEDLHRTLTAAVEQLWDHLAAAGLLEDLRYHAGMLGSRLETRRTELATAPDTVPMTDKDLI